MRTLNKDTSFVFLPPWISGRYNSSAKAAILYNSLLGEQYYFETDSAQIIGKLLSYDYGESICLSKIASELGFGLEDINDFKDTLLSELILVDHPFGIEEIHCIRNSVIQNKKDYISNQGGINQLPSMLEAADIDFVSKLEELGIPSSVSFELTYGCNERCIHCYNPSSPRQNGIPKKVARDEMVLQDYKRVLDELAEIGVPKVLFTGGDPFVKKDFLDILRYAHQRKFCISIYTNGLSLATNPLLYDEVLNCYPYQLGLSIYSMDKEKHDSITRIPGSLTKTLAIADKLYRDAVSLQVKCPIMKINKCGYSDVLVFAATHNAVPEFEINITAGIDGDTFATDYLRLSEDDMREVLSDPVIPLSPLREPKVKFKERTPSLPFCGAGINSANITPSGDVYPCMAFPLKCGNVKSDSFDAIWKNSPELTNVRKLNYGMSDRCGKESFCMFCNRCIGQSYIEHGIPENASRDNCFIARIREEVFLNNKDNSAS